MCLLDKFVGDFVLQEVPEIVRVDEAEGEENHLRQEEYQQAEGVKLQQAPAVEPARGSSTIIDSTVK